MHTRRNTNRLYVNVSFFEFSCVFSASVFSNTNVYFLIQNKNIISVNSLLRANCLTSALIGGASVVYPFFLSLSYFNVFLIVYVIIFITLCVFFFSLILSKWCCRRVVCLHLAYRKVRNIFLKCITFCDIFFIKSEFVVFFMMFLYSVGTQRSVASDYSCRAYKNRRACFVVSRFLSNFVSIYNKV